eukprot:642039-Pelagomonas_calceolata.AAC.6
MLLITGSCSAWSSALGHSLFCAVRQLLQLLKGREVMCKAFKKRKTTQAVKTLPTSFKEKKIPRAKAPCIPFTKRNKQAVKFRYGFMEKLGCEQGLSTPDEAKLLFQVTPLVADRRGHRDVIRTGAIRKKSWRKAGRQAKKKGRTSYLSALPKGRRGDREKVQCEGYRKARRKAGKEPVLRHTKKGGKERGLKSKA